MDRLSDQELAHALRGCLASCMNKSLRRLRKPFGKFNGLLKTLWGEGVDVRDFLHSALASYVPNERLGTVYEVCEVAFPKEERYYTPHLYLWAFVPEVYGERTLPFAREKCERFIVAFFESHLSLLAHYEISKCAKVVVEQARKEGLPESSRSELMRAELRDSYADYESVLRTRFPKKVRRWLEEEGRMVGTKFTTLYLGACARIGLAATREMAPQDDLELSEVLSANVVSIEDFRKRK